MEEIQDALEQIAVIGMAGRFSTLAKQHHAKKTEQAIFNSAS